MIAILQG